MMWSLPVSVDIDGTEYKIRNKCDYRVVLDVINALNDNELELDRRMQCALYIFYEDLTGCEDIRTAIVEMMKIVNLGEETKTQEQDNKPPVMDWEHDFNQLAPPISRVLGYSVRDANHYTHWYDFIGAYMEIGECTFANIISIRSKRAKGKKLDENERQFYNENKKMVDLSQNLTEEEKDWLEDW